MLGSKAFVIWQQEVCDHSQLLQVCHTCTGQISQGHTKQTGLHFRSGPIFSRTASVLAMRTPRDDLLEAEQHQSHVCYGPLESQPLLRLQSRPGMVIQKGFSLYVKSTLTFRGPHKLLKENRHIARIFIIGDF